MTTDQLIDTIRNRHSELYRSKPTLVVAPGRINLIGEHTDYNEGFVLPAAIDRAMVFSIGLNGEDRIRLFSYDYNESVDTRTSGPHSSGKRWALYLIGVLDQFRKEGIEIQGLDCVFGGNIPLGAGLSSSAALESGFAFGLNSLLKTGFSPRKIVLMAQKAEHESVGVMCGIMDQYASVFGKKDAAIRLDCRTNTHDYFRLKMDDYVIALVDTGVKHELASTEYNLRRQECEKGVAILQERGIKALSLRDASPALIEEFEGIMDPVVFRRCHYVTAENERVLLACDALEKNDLALFGELMYASHEGLKNEYEVSCAELDFLVDLTKTMDFVYGARMMGGGFGGCTINLLDKRFTGSFQSLISKAYADYMKTEPSIYFIRIEDGVHLTDDHAAKERD